jgi:uncharacterized membrane protein
MKNRTLINGFVFLGAGLLVRSLSSFLAHFMIFGTAQDFVMGFFDGLAVVAFLTAIFLMVRGSRSREE